MPYKSKAQEKKFFAMEARGELPKGTARRWAHHTPNQKSLPEHVAKKKSADEELLRRVFAAQFLVKCAAAGVTDPDAVASLALRLAAEVTARATQTKRAEGGIVSTLGDLAGRASALPVIGTVGLPLAAGTIAGATAGQARNLSDDDDAETLRIRAAANAYRRRAAAAAANSEVRKLVASDPNRYVPLG